MSKIYDALKRAEREREIVRDRGGRDNGHTGGAVAARNGQEVASIQLHASDRVLGANVFGGVARVSRDEVKSLH